MSVRPGAPRSSGGGGLGISGILDTAAKGIERGAEQLDHLGGRLSVQALAGARNGLRLGLTAAATFLPNPHLRDVATFAGAVSDTVSAAGRAVGGGMALEGASLWAVRISTISGIVFAGLYAWQAYRSRRWDDRIWYGAQAAGTGLAAAGVMTAGTDLIAIGAGSAEVPPLGLGLMALGGVILAGGCVYRERRWIASSAGRAKGWVTHAASTAAGAAADAGRSLVNSLNPF
jgi:hypothetical protein